LYYCYRHSLLTQLLLLLLANTHQQIVLSALLELSHSARHWVARAADALRPHLTLPPLRRESRAQKKPAADADDDDCVEQLATLDDLRKLHDEAISSAPRLTVPEAGELLLL
jgi:hypothetical protein